MNEISLNQLFNESNEVVLDSGILIAYFMDENTSIISLLDKFIFNKASSIKNI